jgi:hypothetical protein
MNRKLDMRFADRSAKTQQTEDGYMLAACEAPRSNSDQSTRFARTTDYLEYETTRPVTTGRRVRARRQKQRAAVNLN